MRLGDVVVEKTGTRNPGDQPDAEFVYVDVAAVDNELKLIAQPKTMIGADAPSRARKVIRGGDVLVSTVRPNLNAVALVPSSLDGQIASTGFCVLRAKSDLVLPEYLFYYTRTPVFIARLIGLVAGAMYPAVTDRQVLDQRIPIPSLDEQRRIVDLLSRAEGIVRLRREVQANGQAIIPALFVDMFGDPAKNPKGWPMIAIEDLCSVRTGATPRREQRLYYDGGTIPWVKTGEICESSIVDVEEHITEKAVEETNCKVFPVNTILVAMYGQGQTRGRVGLLKVPAATNQACAAILPGERINQNFLYALLMMQYERLRAMGRGGNQANLNLGMIKSFRVPCPPLGAQLHFEERRESVVSITAQQAEALKKAEDVFASILACSFGN
ncbi:restriction endonuclease subunit S [Burkholderia pseudomallei]|nr:MULTISPECIES: restriction endonuclease subunit S [Burkholderia]MBF4052275.1 restriction endonuclease subunit S [Burkholderia pseudomallei]MBO7770665.1 restriction endonuclease subunit S [Burkholderia pseudomallei]MBO7872588.1 restriction endonuclease subunit S [Burkholderia pseudomallei]